MIGWHERVHQLGPEVAKHRQQGAIRIRAIRRGARAKDIFAHRPDDEGPSGWSGSEALRRPSCADAAAGMRAIANAAHQMGARISSLYTHEPAAARPYVPAYSTMVSCELENENGWKIVVRPNASFALTVYSSMLIGASAGTSHLPVHNSTIGRK